MLSEKEKLSRPYFVVLGVFEPGSHVPGKPVCCLL